MSDEHIRWVICHGCASLTAYLEERYTRQRLALHDIAVELGVSPTQVRRLLDSHDVQRRSGRAHR